MIPDCTGLVLAGGESRRMGRDKTALEIGGQTLLQGAVARLRSVFPEVLVSVRRARADIDAPQVIDEPPGAGPLAGLCAGLAASRQPWVFALAADMPFLSPETIRELAARRAGAQAVAPLAGGVPQPLAAFYAAAALPALRALLAAPGRHSLRAALETLDAVYVPESQLHPPPRAFTDIDTPEDLAAVGGLTTENTESTEKGKSD
jgi:molybdopterin-guanine dinucleotide biosynthesis protein A